MDNQRLQEGRKRAAGLRSTLNKPEFVKAVKAAGVPEHFAQGAVEAMLFAIKLAIESNPPCQVRLAGAGSIVPVLRKSRTVRVNYAPNDDPIHIGERWGFKFVRADNQKSSKTR